MWKYFSPLGRETGSNKITASKSCALSLVRQLFHLGVIDAFTGTLKKDRSQENQVPKFPVKINPDLYNRIRECLNNLQITPSKIESKQDRSAGTSNVKEILFNTNFNNIYA